MTTASRISAIIEALGIPAGARVDSRVPKKLLVEQGAPTVADKRAIQDGVEDIHWVGACKPNTIGVLAFADEHREYLEVTVLTIEFRPGAKGKRLVELIHRAVPYPVLLISEDAEGVVVSIAHKRHAQNEAGKVVIEAVVRTAPLKDLSGAVERAFLEQLPIAKQPSNDLYTLYEGWRTCIDTLNVAQIVGSFRLADDPVAINQQRQALDGYLRLSKEVTQLRAQAARAKQINQRVELNQKIKAITDELARQKTLMVGGKA